MTGDTVWVASNSILGFGYDLPTALQLLLPWEKLAQEQIFLTAFAT